MAAVSLAAASAPARAQPAPRVKYTLTERTLAESLSALNAAAKFARAHQQDAPAWYRLGSLANDLYQHVGFPPRVLGVTRLDFANQAWDGLRRAVALDSGKATYWATLADYYATLGPPQRDDADSATARALRLGRVNGDTALVTELLVRRGTRANSLYSPLRFGPMSPSTPFNGGVSPRAAVQTADSGFAILQSSWDTYGESVWRAAGGDTAKDLPRLLQSAITNVTEHAQRAPFSEWDDSYLRANEYLSEAHTLSPSDAGAYGALTTLYVSRARWNELASVALDRTVRAPADAWGWMALGLAEQRRHRATESAAAFEKGLARLNVADRAWLDRVDRLLDPRDSVRFAHADAKTRAETVRQFWGQADPLWSADDETPRTEFLARVTFAELRWSDSLRHRHGADTYVGALYVRYGPPDRVVGTFWIYDAGLIFDSNLRFSRYDIPANVDRDPDDQDTAERIRRWQPSRWDNIAMARVDSMPTQVARFREGRDSIAVFLATQAPMAEFRKVTAKNEAVVAHYWLNSRDGTVKVGDSLVIAASGAMQFTRRVPSGPYYYRVEAVVPGALVAARTAAAMMMGPDTTGFATTGFGMSDVLVASRVTPHGTDGRWSDFDVTPVLGDVAHGSSLAFVWENYDLAARDGRSNYTLKISLERKWKMLLNKIRARIINAWGAMRGVEQTSERIVYTYDRTVASSRVVTDYVTLELADTPAGNYEVKIEVTDTATGTSTSRTLPVVIRE